MHVRLSAVTGVSAAAHLLPWFDEITIAHAHTAALQMREKDEGAVSGNVDDDVVARQSVYALAQTLCLSECVREKGELGPPGDMVACPVIRFDDATGDWSVDRGAEADKLLRRFRAERRSER